MDSAEIRSGCRPPAPGRLGIVQGYINSLDIEAGRDELSSPLRLREWMVAHSLMDDGPLPTDEDLRVAVEVREALRALALHNGGERPQHDSLAVLNRAARQAPLNVTFDPAGEARLISPAGGPAAALGAILGIVLMAMADGTWERLKACHCETCRWAFYDHSKNRSSSWCSMRICGNRTKTRTYRRRQTPVT